MGAALLYRDMEEVRPFGEEEADGGAAKQRRLREKEKWARVEGLRERRSFLLREDVGSEEAVGLTHQGLMSGDQMEERTAKTPSGV